MILITIFNPATRKVLSHKTVSHEDMVISALPVGTKAIIGRWVPYDVLVDDGVDFFLSSPKPQSLDDQEN